jgi:membrane fusion protein, macrolide-specific efflux system
LLKKGAYSKFIHPRIKPILVIALVGLHLFTTVGCSVLPVEEVVIEPKTVQSKPNVEYYTVEAKRGDITTGLSILGDFKTIENKEYSFSFQGGPLKTIYVKPGDVVKSGTVLAELENNNVDIRIRQQELQLQKAEIAYEQAKAMSKADPFAAKIAEIDVESARLQLKEMKLELDKSRIISVNTGVVDFVENFKAGDFVEVNKTVVRVVNNKKIELIHDGDDSKAITKKLPAEVSLDGKTYKASVLKEGKTSVSFQVDGLAMGQNLIGQYANIYVIAKQKKNVIIIPNNVIHNYNGQVYVKVLDNGIQTERIVKLGLANESMSEVVSGLKVGEKVIG